MKLRFIYLLSALLICLSTAVTQACVIGDGRGCLREAEAGDAKAQTGLALMFIKGRGVPKDPSRALYWYGQAAEQGNAYAQTELGLMYLNGEVVPKDITLAVKWLKAGAEQGYAGAQRQLARLYETGEGVSKDLAIAERLHNAASGDTISRFYMIFSVFMFFLTLLSYRPLSELVGREWKVELFWLIFGGAITLVTGSYVLILSVIGGAVVARYLTWRVHRLQHRASATSS